MTTTTLTKTKNPTIKDDATGEYIPVQLGDVVTWGHGTDFASRFTQACRVHGWSPDGTRLNIGWVGDVSVEDCKWYTKFGTPDLQFALMYKPVKTNRWGEGVTPLKESQLVLSQHDIPVINSVGKRVKPQCTAPAVKPPIPGLDASLCRCEGCMAKDAGGVWQRDQKMTERLTIYKNKQSAEDIRDTE